MLSSNRNQRCYFLAAAWSTVCLFPFLEKFEGYTFPALKPSVPGILPVTTAARAQHMKGWKEKGGELSPSPPVVTSQLKIQNKYQHTQECLNTISELVSPLTDLNLHKNLKNKRTNKPTLHLLLAIQGMYFSLD